MTQWIDPRRTSLFLDIDGTLLDFAATPEQVWVDPRLVTCLLVLHQKLSGALAFVSGRTIEDIDRLFQPLRFAAAGVHGAEIRVAPDAQIRTAAMDLLPEILWVRLSHVISEFPGVFAENKAFAFAVHYRNVPECKTALTKAVETLAVEAKDPSLALLHGHCVLEFKRRAFEKGMAIDHLMLQPAFEGRAPIFIGDDATDLPGFAAVLRRGGRAYSVGRSMEGLTGAFETPQEVRDWLYGLAAQIAPAPGETGSPA